MSGPSVNQFLDEMIRQIAFRHEIPQFKRSQSKIVKNVVMDVYPDHVHILMTPLTMVVDWTSINPQVIQSLVDVKVDVCRRPHDQGMDYEIDRHCESVVRLHLAFHGQKMIKVRAQKDQTHFKRRH